MAFIALGVEAKLSPRRHFAASRRGTGGDRFIVLDDPRPAFKKPTPANRKEATARPARRSIFGHGEAD
jgi:hypothetical protein